MRLAHLFRIYPYFVVLAVAGYFYMIADRFVFTPVPGRIGPDLWPKLVLTLLIAVCIFECVRRTIAALAWGKSGEIQPAERSAGADAGETLEEEEDHPGRVAGAIVATIAYLSLYETIGFFLDTLWFLIALMWIGRFQKPLTSFAIALTATLLFMLVFMKAVFVSLPLGVEPFSKVSTAVMRLMGIQ